MSTRSDGRAGTLAPVEFRPIGMGDDTSAARLRELPSIDELLSGPRGAALLAEHPRPWVVRALRDAVSVARARLLAGEARGFADDDVDAAVARLGAPRLRPVLNATGVVLHTNLGRAPLARRAVERVARVAQGYCNLELDLETGGRGSRYAHVTDALCALTGAEAALVVNNCAAAVLLCLSELAHGREAVVSRGELVEIGGGFRVPEVMLQSGARLVEVGTTNRTRLSDYERALGPETGALVKVHRSNFAVVGFTEEVAVDGLAALGGARGVPLFVDLGSGALTRLRGEGLGGEPTVREVVAAGADLVSFSADKLLGGPQAGVVVGRAALVERLAKHPLNRALRVDKLTLAALEATLELYRDGLEDAEVPTRGMLGAAPAELEARAAALGERLSRAGVGCRVERAEGRVGGGSLPLAALPSWAVVLDGGDAEALQAALRAASPPVIARVADGRLWLDVRCLRDEDVEAVAGSVLAVGKTPC